MTKGGPLFCPLYERNIASGKCLDINYERLHYVRHDYLRDLVRIRKLPLQELEQMCYDCPNQPFPDNTIGEIRVNKQHVLERLQIKQGRTYSVQNIVLTPENSEWRYEVTFRIVLFATERSSRLSLDAVRDSCCSSFTFEQIYGPRIDEPICLIDIADGNAVYYYHFDGPESVVALSDVDNVLAERRPGGVSREATSVSPNTFNSPPRLQIGERV